jgi:hypothetical protein
MAYPWMQTGVPDLSGMAPIAKPEFLRKRGLLESLFSPGDTSGLFDQATTGKAGQMGLLNAGLSLLASGGKRPHWGRPNLGQALQRGLQAGQQGYDQVLQGASQLGNMRAQQAEAQKAAQQEAREQQIIAEYGPNGPQTPQKLAEMTGRLAAIKGNVGAAATAAGVWQNTMPEPQKPGTLIQVDAGDYKELRDPVTGALVDRVKKGVDPDTLARERAANWRASLAAKDGAGPAVKPPTAQERTNAGLTMLIKDGIRQIDQIVPQGDARTVASGTMQKVPFLGRFAQKPIQRQYNDAVGQVVQNAIYLLSGKAVTESESQRLMNQYGYVPGDDEQTLKAKRQRMDVLVQAAEMMSGRAGTATPADGTQPVAPMQPGETPEQYLQRTGVQ